MNVKDSDILLAIDQSHIGYAVYDRSGRVLHASPSATQLLTGGEHDDITGRLWFDLDHSNEERKQMRRELFATFLDRNAPWRGIILFTYADGSLHYLDTSAAPFGDDKVLLVFHDCTEQVTSTQATEEREKLSATLLDRLPVGVMLQRMDGRIVYINSAMTERHGISAGVVIGRRRDDVSALASCETLNQMFRDVLLTRKPIEGQAVSIQKGPLAGTHWLFYLYPLFGAHGDVEQIMTVEFDRTEHTRLQEEKSLYQDKLHEMQKIEALNRFAGGMAHELSNILHPAGVYARALAANPDLPDRARLAGAIDTAVLQAGSILRQTLEMSRNETAGIAAVDLGSFLAQLVTYANDVAAADLRYRLEPVETGLSANADESQLRQVMLNLMINAADAQGGAGEIRIRAGRGGTPDREAESLPTSAGPFAWIEVIDRGRGIEPEIRARIFEPFFTTKSRGEGTGLGLALVQALVAGWGGIVSVASGHGTGTTFRVWIPQARMTSLDNLGEKGEQA